MEEGMLINQKDEVNPHEQPTLKSLVDLLQFEEKLISMLPQGFDSDGETFLYLKNTIWAYQKGQVYTRDSIKDYVARLLINECDMVDEEKIREYQHKVLAFVDEVFEK